MTTAQPLVYLAESKRSLGVKWRGATDGNGHYPLVWGLPFKGQPEGSCGIPGLGVGPVSPAWSEYSALLCLAPGWGPGHLLGWGCPSPSLCLPHINQEAALEVPSPRTVRIPADVCESGSWSGFQRMFFLAGLCGGGGRRGPRQGHVQLSRQRPADWVVTVLGHSASDSQALGEGERGYHSGGLMWAGTTLSWFSGGWVVCVGVLHQEESGLGSGIGPGWGGGQV